MSRYALLLICSVLSCLLLLVGCKGGGKEIVEKEAEFTPTAEFAEAYNALKEGETSSRAASGSYDLERTMQVMRAMELAEQNASKLEDYLDSLQRMDLSCVAPDVLRSKTQMLALLQEMRQLELRSGDDELLNMFHSAMNVARKTTENINGKAVGGAAVFAPTTLLAVIGKDAAVQGFNELQKYIEHHIEKYSELEVAMNKLRSRYLEQLAEYAPICERYTREWDALCLLKDHAYLAIHRQRFDQTLQLSQQILSTQPGNREALLLKALALTMQAIGKLDENALANVPLSGSEDFVVETMNDVEGENGAEEDFALAIKTLEEYIRRYPGCSAPALVLSGIIELSQGREAEGLTTLDHAAMEYPRQAAKLSEMFDLYEARAYLNQSREGTYVLALYRATMEGFGIFSPNLIKAGYHYRKSRDSDSRKEIFDHFFRRGNQGVYHCLLSDMQFCDRYLDACFGQMLPEHSFIDIETSKAIGKSNTIKVSIRNRSDVTLQNVRVFLCLHLTDMYTDEYEIVKVPTKNQVSAHQETELDNVDFGGNGRTYNDIAHVRAIVMTDDAICWVDQVSYRQEDVQRRFGGTLAPKMSSENEAELSRRAKRAGFEFHELEAIFSSRIMPFFENSKATGFLNKMKKSFDKLSNAVIGSEQEKWLSADGKLKFEMPREIMQLDPLFMLKQPSGQMVAPEISFVDNSSIRLLFDVTPKEDEQYVLYIYGKRIGCKLLLQCADDDVQFIRMAWL